MEARHAPVDGLGLCTPGHQNMLRYPHGLHV